VLALSGLCFFALAVKSNFKWDDYTYANSARSGKLLPFLAMHARDLNGRLPTHGLLFLLLRHPPVVFAVVAAAAYMGLALALYLLAGRNLKEPRTGWLVLSQILLWATIPVPSEVFFWRSAACTFFIGSTVALWVIVPYRLAGGHDPGKAERPGRWPAARAAGMFLLALAGGWSNECMGLALVLTLALFCAKRKWIDKQPWRLWMLAGLAGALTGFLALMLAPAQWSRVQEDYAGVGRSGLAPVLHATLLQALNLSMNMLLRWTPLLAVLLVCIGWRMQSGRKALRHEVLPSLIFLAGALAAVYVLCPVVFLRDRAFAVSWFLLLPAVGSALPALPHKGKMWLRACAAAALGLLCAQALHGYRAEWREAARQQQLWQARDAYIRAEKAKGHLDVTVINLQDLTEDPQSWPNRAVAAYYGLHSVAIGGNPE
jgi:hypothetical protein